MVDDPYGKIRSNEDWINAWESNKTIWHRPYVHPMLEKYLDTVTAGRQSCRIFFPLCGKAIDMKWLADLGHKVVGVDLSEKAIKQFFQEQNVEYSVIPVENVPEVELYKSKDEQILLYRGDLFAVPRDILGKFDGIWDRGAFGSINKKYKERYVDLIESLMAPDCKYLLSTFQYDPAMMPAPPYCILDNEVRVYYGNKVEMDLLETHDYLTERYLNERLRNAGHKWMTESIYLVTPKL